MRRFERELEFAEELAREAAVIAKKYFSYEMVVEIKKDNSPLTAADMEINQLVINRCQEAYPSIGILGEEQSTDQYEGRLVWVCDPVDGTIPYTLGMPISTFCLALVEDGVPQVGIVYDFWNDNLYSGVKGSGAWVNGKDMVVQSQDPMRFVSLEWWHAARFDLSGVREKLFIDGYQVPNFASGAFTSMMVAMGRITGLISASDKPWDIAAPKVIVEQLGGCVTDLSGNEQRYDQDIKGAVITNKIPHDAIMDYLPVL